MTGGCGLGEELLADYGDEYWDVIKEANEMQDYVEQEKEKAKEEGKEEVLAQLRSAGIVNDEQLKQMKNVSSSGCHTSSCDDHDHEPTV